LPATGIAVSNATLNASAAPNGLETTVYFQWGTTAGYGSMTPPVDIGSGTGAMAVNAGLSNLLPGTTYHFAVVASNSVGVVTGADASFTTPALAPLATTLPATSVTPVSAGLNGTVNPDGAATTAYFQWGTNTSYGSTTASTSAGSGNGNVAIHTTLANLLPGTMYHYTVAASNSVGAVTDSDVTFLTPAATPTATTLPASGIAVSNATLNASVNPNGAATTVYFQWGTTTDYGNTTTVSGIGGGVTNVGMNAAIANLLPGTTYHYVIIASNNVGVATGADGSFTTPALVPVATTLPATAVTASSAGLNGTVNPNGAATTAYFLWGTNATYGSSTASTSAGSGNGNVAIHTTLANLLPGTMYHYTVAASNSVGGVTDSDVTFMTPAATPTVTTLPASGIAVSNATLNATVNPNGATTTIYFQWGTTTSYGNTTALTGIGSGTSATAVNAAISSLLPGTTYHYLIIASNSVGMVTGADGTFTTPALVPMAATLPATGVTVSSAALNGMVDPNGAAATAYFQWGTNTSYGSSTALTSAGSGNGDVMVNTALGNLSPGTVYHYLIVASNSVGTVSGVDATFTTPALAPMATTLPASGVVVSNAILNASVNPEGSPTIVYFQWGATSSYGNTTGPTGAGNGANAVAINSALANLLPGATYHYTVVASNSVGVTVGADATFTIPALTPIATTLPATGISVSSATLNAAVNPNGAATTVNFQWGTNTMYGSSTTPNVIGSGLTTLPVTAALNGLKAGVGYHFRIVATSGLGTSYGADRVFGAPALTLNGPNPMTNECSVPFTDPGAVATGFIGVANTTISAGVAHNLALQGNGLVVAWGDDSSGQTNLPAGLDKVVSVAAGGTFSIALQNDGSVIGWGDNSDGQTNIPASVTNAIAIAAGGSHVLALRADGTVIGWGNDSSGQTNIPAGLSNVTAIAAGQIHSLALRTDGSVIGWGDNSSGQTNIPAGVGNVIAIAAGDAHNLALRSDGTVIGWGYNSSGQTNVPANVINATAIAAGHAHSLALLGNGTVIAWGDNSSGQTNVPVGLNNVVAIAAGYEHSLALQADGTVVAWGNDGSGQTMTPSNLVVALPQTAITGDLTSDITVSGSANIGALGGYQLIYTVGDVFGTTNTVTRTVVVNDTIPPQITCPQNILQAAPLGQTSVAVNFATPAASDQCSAVSVGCVPASGSLFPAGTNTVNCTATDSSGNAASCSFLVVVDLPPVVNAGTAQAIVLPVNSVTLHGTVSDDGLIGPLTMGWTKLSGPGTVTFGNAAAASTTATFSTNGTYVLQLTASDGLVSTSDHVTIVVDSPPKITQPPTAIGGLELGDGTLVVPTDEATIFTIGTSDAGGTPTSLWNFGDGTLSTNNTPAYTFTNCGPRQVTVTVSDGISSTSQVLTVQAACQMIMTTEKIEVSFASHKHPDTFSSRGILNLPTDMVATGVSVAVQVGSVQQVFTLDKHGRGRNTSGNITVSYSKRRGWTYNVSFKGNYAGDWAANGLSNATVKNVPVHVPVFVIFDTNPLYAYMSDNVLQYTATKNKQGTAKK